ncbi:MAG: hypothetical protein FVQ80_15700 [Planctomycetes bacterium]|nr:hypothetical protein [Planctomycetota bacterium]
MTEEAYPPKITAERTLLEGFLYYLSILLRYKWLIIIITSISAVGVVAFSIITIILPPEKSPLPNIYQAQSVLLVQEAESGALGSIIMSLGLSLPGGPRSPPGGLDYGQMALMILRSRIILDPLVEEFIIVDKNKTIERKKTTSRRALLSHAEFNYARSTGALTISYSAIDPVFASEIVNRMVELLNEWFLSKGGTRKLKQKDLLEKKIGEVSLDISKLEDEIQDFQKKHGALTVEELAVSQATLLADLRSQLVLKEMAIKNYMQFTKIEDPVLIRLKAERDNILELIEQKERDFSRMDFPALSLEFARLRMALDIQTRIFKSLSEQYEIIKLSLESEPVFQILELAEVPDVKSGPSRSKICMVTVLIAFMGSIMLAFFLNTMNKIRNKEKVE